MKLKEHHGLLNKQTLKINKWRLVAYMMFSIIMFFGSETFIVTSSIYSKIYHLFGGFISKGSFSYLLALIVFTIIFLTDNCTRANLKLIFNNPLLGLSVLLGGFAFITVLELVFGLNPTILAVFQQNSFKSLIESFVYLFLIAVTEEIIYTFIWLNQSLKRVSKPWARRIVIHLNATYVVFTHLPILWLAENLSIGAVIYIYLSGFLSSLVFLKYRNLFILISVHFIMDLSIVCIGQQTPLFALGGLLILGFLLIEQVRCFLIKIPPLYGPTKKDTQHSA